MKKNNHGMKRAMEKSNNNHQFRRDPISGNWSLIINDEKELRKLAEDYKRKTVEDINPKSKYAEGNEGATPPEIFAIRDPGTNRNDRGWKVRVLPNNDPFLQIHGDLDNRGAGMYDVMNGIGAHELVLESPTPGEHLADMSSEQLQNVLAAYRERILDLKRDTRFRYVLLHKSHGEGDEDLLHHSHSHVIATPMTPPRIKVELNSAKDHYDYKERCLFCDIINQEISEKERIISENEQFIALSPFASRTPFEICIYPKKHQTFFEWNTEFSQLATTLKTVLGRIKSILNDPKYIMVIHSGPNIAAGKRRGYWKTIERDYHWHIEITPRFHGLTSFYIGSGFQINVASPERAAGILRSGRF